jgi:hypothetical protein
MKNMKIEYVTECKLKLSNPMISTIQRGEIKIKPKFLKIVRNSQIGEENTFDIYISLADKVLVYSRSLNELIPSV